MQFNRIQLPKIMKILWNIPHIIITWNKHFLVIVKLIQVTIWRNADWLKSPNFKITAAIIIQKVLNIINIYNYLIKKLRMFWLVCSNPTVEESSSDQTVKNMHLYILFILWGNIYFPNDLLICFVDYSTAILSFKSSLVWNSWR